MFLEWRGCRAKQLVKTWYPLAPDHTNLPIASTLQLHFCELCVFKGRAVSRRQLTSESRVRARVNPCGICGGQNDTETGFSPSSSVFPCQYHPIVVLHTHMPSGWLTMAVAVAAVQRRSLTPSKSTIYNLRLQNWETAFTDFYVLLCVCKATVNIRRQTSSRENMRGSIGKVVKGTMSYMEVLKEFGVPQSPLKARVQMQEMTTPDDACRKCTMWFNLRTVKQCCCLCSLNNKNNFTPHKLYRLYAD
jgi:hypothetical protein